MPRADSWNVLIFTEVQAKLLLDLGAGWRRRRKGVGVMRGGGSKMRGIMREEGRLERKEGLHSRGHLEAMLAHASWCHASKGEKRIT